MTSEPAPVAGRAVVRMLVGGWDPEEGFDLSVEPEGMSYNFPPERQIVLEFRGPDAMDFEISHARDGLVIWRPADTEVWAGPVGGPMRLIGGRPGNPFWMDTGGDEDLRAWWRQQDR